jgi:predicted nucleic acid-binding protein
MRPKGWIVDASVALKWHLRDEQYVPQADALFRAFTLGEAELLAPSFIRYEVANALLVASKRGRISLEAAQEQLQDFLALAIHQAADEDALVTSALGLASSLDVTVYDALYLALSEQSGSGLVTADRQLYNKVRNALPQTVWVEDIRVETP